MKNILLKDSEVKFPLEVLEKLIDKDSLVVKVEAIVNWEEIKHLLESKVKRGSAKAGQKPYSSVLLFKVLLLQRWYNLSDAKVEEAIKTRIDFMWFTNFGLANQHLMYPDETTICRFRNQIVKAGIEERLLKIVNEQLENLNLKVKISEGALIDATLIQASTNSTSKPKVIVEDRKEDDDNLPNFKELSANEQEKQIDKDAKWLKKGKKNIFGFKKFVVTDNSQGFVERVVVKGANVSEKSTLKEVIEPLISKNIKELAADKGYCSEENKEYLKNNKIKDRIMDQAYRNTPLTRWQKLRNTLISKKRYIVERTNATTKNIFNFYRAKYIGLKKVSLQAHLVALAHNLLKAVNKITLDLDHYKKMLTLSSLAR